MTTYNGILSKMATSYDESTKAVSYQLVLDNEKVLDMNPLVGSTVRLCFNRRISCVHCGRNVRKTYSQGYCYPCSQALPQADMCMMKPEQCHYHLGTCRDPAWGEAHCFKQHFLYLARSSGIKVGITRDGVHRWMDQGALEALVIGHFDNRLDVGKAEKAISAEVSDKTNWRNMLKNVVTDKPFEPIIELARNIIKEQFGDNLIDDKKVFEFVYPVKEYPQKVTSLKLDKCPFLEDELTGIKGQYLIFGDRVINLRAHTGYSVEFSHE